MRAVTPRSLVLLLLTLWIAACGGSDSTAPGTDNPDPPDPPNPVPATVEVTPASDSLGIGDTAQLQAVVKDASGATLSGETITWSSSDDAVATVSSTGEVTAVADGAAQVTASAGSVSGSAALSVFAGLSEVGDTGGGVATDDGGATLDIPAGALNTSTPITVTPTDPAAVAVGAVDGTAFEFGPDGLVFGAPATLTLSYDPANLPAGADESTLVLVRNTGTDLERLENVAVDTNAGTVQGSVPGFSSFAICLPSETALCGADPEQEVDLVVEDLGSLVPANDPVGQGVPFDAPVALYQAQGIEVRNDGTADATGVEITFSTQGPLVEQGLYVEFPNDDDPEQAVMSCADGAVDGGGAVTSVTCAVPAIAAGEGLTDAVGGTVLVYGLVPSGTTSLVVDVEANAAGAVAEAAPEDNSLQLALPYYDTPATDLVATLTAPQSVTAGSGFVVTLAVDNAGEAQTGPEVDGISVLVQLDGINFGQDLPAQCALDQDLGSLSAVRCTFSNLAAADIREFDFELAAPQGGEVAATAVIDSWDLAVDTNPGNNAAASSTTVRQPESDISAALVGSREVVDIGDTLTYTVTVTNQGPDPLGLGTAVLAANGPVDYAPGFAAPDGCSLATGGTGIGFSCGLVDVPVGGSRSYDLQVQATGGGTIEASGGLLDAASSTDPDESNDIAEVTTTVNAPTADLAFDLTQDPATLNGGQPATFTFSVSNPSTFDAEGVWYYMSIFGDVTAAASWTLPDGCELGNTVEGGADIGVLCRPVTVPAGGTVGEQLTVDISGSESALRVVGGIAEVGNVSDPDLTNNEFDQVLSVTPAPLQTDLAISYALNPATPIAGGEVAATVTVTNLGAEGAADVAWVMNFNNGVSAAAGYTPPAGCVLGTPADPSVDGTGLLCSGVSIPAGGSASETINIAVADTASVIDVLGSIQDFGTVEDTNAGNNSVSETVTVEEQTGGGDPLIVLDPDSVAFDVVEGGMAPNARLVTILNGGGGTLAGLDAGISYGSGQPTGWMNASIFNDGTNDFVVVQVNQAGLAGGTYSGTVTIFESSASNSPKDLPVVINVLPAADVGVALAGAPATVDVGTTIDYQVTVTNNGPATATDVVFTLAVSGTLLSPGSEFTPAGCSLFTSPPEVDPAKLYQCTIASMASGASESFTLPLIPQVSGEELGAVATIQTFEGAADPNSANNLAGTQTTVN